MPSPRGQTGHAATIGPLSDFFASIIHEGGGVARREVDRPAIALDCFDIAIHVLRSQLENLFNLMIIMNHCLAMCLRVKYSLCPLLLSKSTDGNIRTLFNFKLLFM